MSDRWQLVATIAEVDETGRLFTYRDGPFEEVGIVVRSGGSAVVLRSAGDGRPCLTFSREPRISRASEGPIRLFEEVHARRTETKRS